MSIAYWFVLAAMVAMLFGLTQMVRLGRRSCFGGAPTSALSGMFLGLSVAFVCLVSSVVVGVL